MRSEELEQVFVRRGAGTIELRLVLESVAGSRERVTLNAPGVDEGAAVRFLVAYLKQNGLRISKRARVRREREGELVDAPELLVQLRKAYAGSGSGDDETRDGGVYGERRRRDRR